MLKTLIAISSCQYYEDNGLSQPMRDTWLPRAVALGMDYKFFYGATAKPKDDVIVVKAHDGYFDLTSKTKEKIKWALFQSYDYMFACLTDCYAAPERLLNCGFQQYDYFGDVYCHKGGNPYCQGGPGYFLSRKAMEYIDADPSNYPNEDCWVGDVLAKHTDIKWGDSKDFVWCGHIDGQGPRPGNTHITAHLSNAPGGYTASLMHDKHRQWTAQ
jgi:hypothetical protein